MKQNKKLTCICTLAILFLLIGLLGWFTPFLGVLHRSWIELPNTEPKGIALDSKGNIYCGSKGYGRIQKYSPDGRFIRGFDTEGGFWRGSDFGFRINEKDQLCITVSGMSKDHNRSVRRLRIYDQQGNLVHTEKYETEGSHYWYDMNDRVSDSAGNRYIFKGFLFPRVIKQTPAGDKSVIISTPLWLWFFQAPFPAFTFFFISMLIIIFLRFRADATELSVPVTKLMFNVEKLPGRRKIVIFAVGIIAIAVFLCLIIPVGIKTYPFLVIIGFVSFAITLAVIILTGFVGLAINIWRCIKLDFGLWKKSFSSSLRTRYEANMALRSLGQRDPVLRKTGKLLNKIGLWCFFIWLILFVLSVFVVLFLDYIGIWKNLID